MQLCGYSVERAEASMGANARGSPQARAPPRVPVGNFW